MLEVNNGEAPLIIVIWCVHRQWTDKKFMAANTQNSIPSYSIK